jgi:hypothetical protein
MEQGEGTSSDRARTEWKKTLYKAVAKSPKYAEGWAMKEMDGRWAGTTTPMTKSMMGDVQPAEATDEVTSP